MRRLPCGKSKIDTWQLENILNLSLKADPFHLIQRPSLFQSGLLSLKSDALKSVSEKLYLEMNPEDAQRLKIEEGEIVQVSTPEGQSLQIKVKFSSKPVPGVMTIPYPSPLIEERGNQFG